MLNWSDFELTAIQNAANLPESSSLLVTQRGLARYIVETKLLNYRSHASIYVKVREMMSAGKGWWSYKGIGRQITIGGTNAVHQA